MTTFRKGFFAVRPCDSIQPEFPVDIKYTFAPRQSRNPAAGVCQSAWLPSDVYRNHSQASIFQPLCKRCCCCCCRASVTPPCSDLYPLLLLRYWASGEKNSPPMLEIKPWSLATTPLCPAAVTRVRRLRSGNGPLHHGPCFKSLHSNRDRQHTHDKSGIGNWGREWLGTSHKDKRKLRAGFSGSFVANTDVHVRKGGFGLKLLWDVRTSIIYDRIYDVAMFPRDILPRRSHWYRCHPPVLSLSLSLSLGLLP